MRNAEKDEIEMRERQERMLREGFRLFSEKAIEPVSMQEVADAAGIGIATLYRYFNTKLIFVIAIGARKWAEYAGRIEQTRKEKRTASMTAAEELEFYLDCYIDLYKNHKALLRFNQNFNNYVQHEGASAEQLRPYLEAIGVFDRFFSELYEKGKLDGTIRTDLPEDKMFAATSHIMLAVAVRYAQGLL
ncbi:MAG: TetR/AcrR family transcriptional regulator, partial [Oscillospiraceae bacterium]|nr:TetR/AcrR family transcriptional regulator [Oscillospiraceae bacterium]